jgi:hypothetical protein
MATVLTPVSDALTLTPSLPALGSLGPKVISAVGAMSSEEHRARLEEAFRRRAADEGEIIAIVGEVDRSQSYRDEGATSTEAWLVERFGVSMATARTLTGTARKAWDIPQLVGALCAGDISLDKVRAVADVATPETDRELADQARGCSVAELADCARSRTRPPAPSTTQSEHDRRFVRFNDEHRTMTAQLPAESYAEAKASLDARIRQIPSDGETPLDQRRCDALMEALGSSRGDDAATTGASPYVVVAHVPLDALVEDSGQATHLAGELEHAGLIDVPTVQRIACDATIAVAVDDDVGHTMYEGRAQRFPTDAQRREVMRRDRHCRFPGCTYTTFTNVHHIKPWASGGPTDLENLVLACKHHHARVHSDGWTMSGNANEELRITAPNGRVMTSRPSPLWTR